MAEVAEASEPGLEGEVLECPHCGNSRMVKDHGSGEVICSTCGLVVEEKSFDRGPEWRSFSQEERESKSRGGPPQTETIHDRGLSTQIDYRSRDARGKNLPPERRSQMFRLRKWHRRGRVEDARDRNLAIALGELKRLSSQLGLPRSVEEGAAKIYRKVVDENMVRGRSIEGMVSAVVYLECRRENIPRSLEEVAGVSRAGQEEIGRDQRHIEKELGVSSGVADPAALVNRFGGRLDLSGRTRRIAVDLIRKAQREGITSGKSPRGISAGALYMAGVMSREKRAQTEVADAAGVTEVTVRNRYKELERELEIPVERTRGRALEYGEKPAAEEAEGPKRGEEAEKKLEAGEIEAKNVTCVNVVASVTFRGTEFDLSELAAALDAEYRPNDFPGISYSPEWTEASFLIFGTGRANCVGATSLDGARKAPGLLAEKIAEEGFEVDPDPEVKIRNIVVRMDFGVIVDLQKLHNSPYSTSYDPGAFPGLQLVLDGPDADFLLFASGQAVLHSGREEDIGPAAERVGEILRGFADRRPLSDETRRTIAWLGKNPRFVDLLRFVRGGVKSHSQIAEELGVEERTAKDYAYKCSGKGAVEHEEENGGTRVEITERGEKVLDAVA